MSLEEYISFISENLSEADLWGQLAEEASELAQAALKMQRLVNGSNPPRKSHLACVQSVLEEHGDLELCFRVLGWSCNDVKVWKEKLPRWANHIMKLRGEDNG